MSEFMIWLPGRGTRQCRKILARQVASWSWQGKDTEKWSVLDPP